MIRIVMISMLSLAAATPITVAQYRGHFYIPFFRQLQQIERSDSYPSASENGGYSSEVTGGDHNDFSSDDSQSHIESSNSGFDDGHQDYSSFTGFNNYHGGEDGSHGGGYVDHGDNYVHTFPVSEHVEVTKPVAVPVYKEIGIPVPQPVKINVPHPVAVGVSQPYPVAVPVSRPVPIQIIKTIAVPVEKKVPYPVEKHIPVPVEKPVPITIEKHIPVPVIKPYPIKVPIYKTIYHNSKGHNYGYSH